MPFRKAVPADLEQWFEARAAEGWAATRLGQWSSIRMRLHRAEPAAYRYVVDMQAISRPDYVPMYEDFGWEHVGQMTGMHVWRRCYSGLRPEAFTDEASKRARTTRVATAAGFVGLLLVVGGVAEAVAAATGVFEPVDMLVAVLVGLMGVAICWVAVTIWRERER
jgi:hypothetical protein